MSTNVVFIHHLICISLFVCFCNKHFTCSFYDFDSWLWIKASNNYRVTSTNTSIFILWKYKIKSCTFYLQPFVHIIYCIYISVAMLNTPAARDLHLPVRSHGIKPRDSHWMLKTFPFKYISVRVNHQNDT